MGRRSEFDGTPKNPNKRKNERVKRDPKKPRIVYLDFVGMDTGDYNRVASKQEQTGNYWEQSRSDSWKGSYRKYQTPEELQSVVSNYFKSCFGPKINKFGEPVYDRNGEPIIVKIKPFTRMGLILACGLGEQGFYGYIKESKARRRDPEFARILEEALFRIDEQAEMYLFDRDAGRGAEFYNRYFKKMTTAKEDAEIDRLLHSIQLQNKEFELKKAILGDESGDHELVIRVVRAKKDEDD